MATLKSLRISNYRGFLSDQEIKFAIPNGKNGSGITLIVGPNNSGKTSVVEALMLNPNKKFTKGERHANPPVVKIESDEGVAEYSNIDKGSQIQLVPTSQEHKVLFDIISSRRYWSSRARQEITPSQFTSTSLNANIRGQSTSLEVAHLLRGINRNHDLKGKFTKLIQRMSRYFTDWTIDTGDDGEDFVKYLTQTALEHRTDFLGDGLISVMRICAHLVADEKGKVLIIDEPELSLHPNSQKELAKIISEVSKDRQIIVCTHSPHFVNFSDFLNGGDIVRLNKIEDKECVVSQLSKTKNYFTKLIGLTEDWHKPQLLDYVAKEMLFYERVLLTEGQEDVALIRRYYTENSKPHRFEIFGYGVGGYGNMGLFLELAKDLNFEKVAALFDKGTSTYESLKKLYESNRVKFFELQTDDIRDKDGCNSKCEQVNKTGVYDKRGDLKNTSEAKHYETLLEEIYQFLEN